MKKIITLILGMFISLGIQAQLNTGDPSGNSTNDKAFVPASKLNLKNPDIKPKSYTPKSVKFVKNHENGLEVKSRSRTNQLPIFISGHPKLNLKTGDNKEAQCYNFLENAKGLMSINNPSEEFKIIKTEVDELGFTHVKMQQEISGIPVYGSEVIFHSNATESFLNGRYEETPELESYVPTLQKKQVEEIVIQEIGGIQKLKEDKFDLFNLDYIKSELVVYEGKLVYHLSVYKNIVDLWEYFVDANTGEILDKHLGMCKFHNHKSTEKCGHNHVLNEANLMELNCPPNGPALSNALDLFGENIEINTYEVNGNFYMIDASKSMFDAINSDIPDNPVGAVWTIDAFNTSPENDDFQFDHVASNFSSFPGDAAGVSAQYNGGQAYLYFKNIHDRESINGNGGNVIGLVNVADSDGSSLGNAFWNGIAMFYGNGDNNNFKPLARGLDVAGHEMSHGVIQATANLEYQGESGALNESFADVFGAMIDRDDWLIGEDVVKSGAFPSGALRSLQDPHNGASTGDFNGGWQPKLYSERFTGSQDNGGVHINSGIPNHAFFLFASDPAVGKNRAEKVYYRALDKYLTKSSQFIDARLAIVQAATDLYGSNVANKAKAAFDGVEIFNGTPTNNQNDLEVNPGDDLILFTTSDQNNLYVADRDGNLIFNPLTEENPISVPSISDDGTEIVFVNESGKLYYLKLDWSTNSIIEEGVLGFSGTYRNVAFSKDGLRMAYLEGDLGNDDFNNEINVFDWVTLSGTEYTLFNPTTVEGVSTSDVLFADVLQFDISGEYVMYDAYNVIESSFGDDIDYWDIGFIKVFDNDSETFTLGTDIQKMFTQLPDGVSVGNPTFSKNSDYIVAFDFIEENSYDVLGINTETGDVRSIFEGNDRLGYPSYSNDDDMVIFNAGSTSGFDVIGGAELEENKIESSSASIFLSFDESNIKWGVWFSNGDRVLSDVEETLPNDVFSIFPNPASETLVISSKITEQVNGSLKITDMMGRTIYNDAIQFGREKSIDISNLTAGQYVLTISSNDGVGSKVFVKQ